MCELGSISRAALELNIAQPALGLQIRSLEHEFDATLLLRSSRGVTPTPAGELLLEYSREVIQADHDLRSRLKVLNDDQPASLTVAMTASLVNLMAGALIEETHEQLPRVGLKIVEGASQFVSQWVLEGRADIGLGFGCEPNAAIEAQPLMRERLFYLSEPGCVEETISLQDVLSRPLALPDEQNSIRHTIEHAAKSMNLPVIGMYEISSLQSSREVARRGIAGAIVPYGGVTGDHLRGELSVRMIVEPLLERTLFLMRRTDRAVSTTERTLTGIILGALQTATKTKAPLGAYVSIEASI